MFYIAKLKNNKAPGLSGMRVEDLKRWAEDYRRNENRRPFELLMELVVTAFESGELPQACNVAVLVLIPKPASNEHRGIGLLEVVWKLISSVINGRMKAAINFDDSIHGFREQRGTGTAIIQQKLRMQLNIANKETGKHVFLDVKKAYDTLDRERTIEILRGYNVGPNILRIIEHFWDRHTIVPRAAGY
jgi:hypothetical protein